MTKSDKDAARALDDLNNAYQGASQPAPTECQVGWEDHDAFREAMRGPVKTADEVGAQRIVKLLGEALRPGKPN